MQEAVIRFQDLPLDILLLIFDQLDWQCLASLSTTCRSLKNAFSAHLRYSPGVHLTNDPDDAESRASPLISDFITIVCRYQPIALSIRKISISIHDISSPSPSILSEETCNQIKHALKLLPDQQYPWTIVQLRGDYESWLLLILLMCRNLESITLNTACELRWHRTAQYLQYHHWPNPPLKHININLSAALKTQIPNRTHDLQDLWLLFSSPHIQSLEITGLQQSNNLYSGGIDRAAIRTIYWPIVLEIPTLYHHTYRGLCNHTRVALPHYRPLHLPTPPTQKPISHSYPNLHTLHLHHTTLPKTWYPLLLPCFASLSTLSLSISLSNHDFPDLRLISLPLRSLSQTLESLVFDIQTPRRYLDWINAARCGYLSLGSLHEMHRLRSATMPWFSWLPKERVDGDPYGALGLGVGDVVLPPGLERLVLSRCELAAHGVVVELVGATLAAAQGQGERVDGDGGSSGGGVLKSIVLQADIELVLREADFVELVREHNGSGNAVEISLQKVNISADDFVEYN